MMQMRTKIISPRLVALVSLAVATIAWYGFARNSAEAKTPAPKTATQGKKIYLWEGKAPLAKGDTEKDKPSLHIFLPPKHKATGAAVIVCPGGGYGHLATDHEGVAVGKWLNSFGVAAFVVHYRHRGRGYGHPAPLLDAQRAIRTVRSKAAQYGVDTKRIGILGFSAGGHLASTAGTHFDAGNPKAVDAIDRVSCRPDFMVLVYPVISFTQNFTHRGSRRNLLGKTPTKEIMQKFSNELQVTKDTPPTFLVHSDQDRGVHPFNSVAFYQALKKHNVPAELHIFQKGSHGYGLGRKPNTPEAQWPKLCESWMKYAGLLKPQKNTTPAK